MKFYVILVSTLIVFSACQKVPDAKDTVSADVVSPENTKDDDQNATVKKTISNCTSKEVTKSVSAETGTVSHTTHESVSKESHSSNLVAKTAPRQSFSQLVSITRNIT